jgi:EmrB/QacA subfamily drug resistance transporter
MSFNTRILPLVIASALFMEQMDSTIIATSLPDIARDLAVSPVSLKLALTTYLLGLTTALPISGYLADRYGARLIFRLAIVIFTVASVACGFAESLEWLIVARGLQGIGAALMVPVGRIILLRSVKKSELLDAMAWLTVPALIGPVVGPPIGGFITTTYDWRWIFWLNLPFGIIAFSLASWLMPEVRPLKVRPFDAKGFVLVTCGLVLSVGAMTFAGRGVVPWSVNVIAFAAGIAGLFLYARHARVNPDPILDLRLMRISTFRQSLIGGNIFRIVAGASPFLIPLMLQLGFGMTAFQSGMITFASTLGALLMKFSVKSLVHRFGFRNLLIWNGAIVAVAHGAPALFTASTPAFVMIGVLLCAGYARSLQFSSLNAIAYADVEAADLAKANALYTVAQQVFLAIGVAVAALVLDLQLWLRDSEVLQTQDFSVAIFVVAAISGLSVISYRALQANAGAMVSGREPQD